MDTVKKHNLSFFFHKSQTLKQILLDSTETISFYFFFCCFGHWVWHFQWQKEFILQFNVQLPNFISAVTNHACLISTLNILNKWRKKSILSEFILFFLINPILCISKFWTKFSLWLSATTTPNVSFVFVKQTYL